MSRFTDGKRIVEIQIMHWEDGQDYGPDWSDDFFNVGVLPYNEDREAYVVNDIEGLIEQTKDYTAGIGDFYDARLDSEACGIKYNPDNVIVTECT